MSQRTEITTSAQRHSRVRRQHSDELAQDYVEAIFELEQTGSPARVTDLQEQFGVSHVSVIRALRRFELRGLVDRSQGDGIVLTAAGREVARQAAARHTLLVRFFRSLGVSETQADADAEGVEHHISHETLAAMRRHLGE